MYAYRRRYTARRTRRFLPRLLILLFVLMLIVWVAGKVRSRNATIISPVPEPTMATQSQSSFFDVFSRKKDPQELRQQIIDYVNNRWVNYSVLVVDYASDFRMGINESIVYDAASVNKIPILAALYMQAQAGLIDLDRNITIQEEDIQAYGTGSIQYDPPGTSYSLRTLARLMMQKSDNTASYVLANHIIGFSNLASLVSSWGLSQTDMVQNTTSNKDMEVLVTRLFSGNLLNQSYTQEIVGFMKDSDFEDRLPALLPDGVTVYHKIGTQVRVFHDVGVVEDADTKYYIGVFTAEVPDEDEAVTMIAELSRLVYDFMN